MAPKMNNSTTSSRLVTEMVKGSHEFKIKGYSLVKGIGVGKFIESETFNVGGYGWAIHFYPDGKEPQVNAVYISVFVALVSNDKDVPAKFEIAMHDQRGIAKDFVLGHFDGSLMKTLHTISVGELWGFTRFYKRFHLEHSMYLNDDCLQLNCTVGVFPTTIDRSMAIQVPESTIGAHFGMLFEDDESSDVTFCVEGDKFRAHKIVLAARSTVFKTQFFSGMDKFDGEILVTDMKPKVFKALLHFIYNDTLEQAEEFYLSQSSFMSSLSELFIVKLLAAAHQYDLPRLKLICESVLCKHISIDSVAHIMALSERYVASELKSICLQFATENLDAVMKSDGFKHLKETCPVLQFELLKSVAAIVERAKPSGSVDTDETPMPNEIDAETSSYNPSSDEEDDIPD
ncbi:unnamed protein product [Sphenostylis stenocarpa]|uniref:BTB/POZ and MATH domain-containing protein 4 n=1 Tax=Sphenostylis stenocarpa TaxID=92480 RepID=A0AA86RSR9_9FABA|nr:unnamed protein product [Sphenostylis stenocarpa]